MEIIERYREKSRLNEISASEQAAFLVVFGRRRVGKTFLIREHFSKNIVFDFTGSFEVGLGTQLQNFFNVYLSVSKGQKETTAPRDWNQAFLFLASYLEALKPRKNKVVVFLDEMPWMDTPRSGFLQALEYFWNQYGSRMPNLLLVACGSATSWMQKKLLQARGGLHNRVTHRIHLHPFTLAETEAYCKYKKLRLSRYQILQIYMALGGIPFYLNELKKGRSAIQAIDEICFQKNGLLNSEYNYLFASLFRNPDNHIAIVETLAAHPQGLSRNEIKKHSNLPEGGTINRVLEELDLSGFISKHQPFQKKKKDTMYKLADLYSLFYLKFIRTKKSNGEGTWISLTNTGTYRAWCGYAFENICMQHIDQIKKALGIAGIYSETSAWKFSGNDELSGAQIDLLIDRKDQVINLCEAKFTEKEFVITKDYAQKLRNKRVIFEQHTKTKKAAFTTLLTTYPAIQNKYYIDEIQFEVSMDALFE
jgi:AAA+ ATPase superfamily predicted ATPase